MHATPAWPPRDSICLDCRTALPAGTPCPAGHSRIRSLRDRPGREALLTEVWGPKSVRQQALDAARAGAASGGGGCILDGCSGCDLIGGDLGEVLIVIAVFIAAGLLIWAIGSGIAALARRRRARLDPAGAVDSGAAVGHATGRTGTVVARAALRPDPLSFTPCVGFAAALEHRSRWWRAPSTMLRDGATLGFEVALDTGERVRVPPGPLVLDLTAARPARLERLSLALYLGGIDPARDRVDDFDPFPCHRMRAVQLEPGDRVELLDVLEARPASGPATGSYREPPATFLTPSGVPRLRKL